MNYCKKCCSPDTKPGYEAKHGICNACRHSEYEDKVNWQDRWLQLKALAGELFMHNVGENRSNCLIPVSGGKDSTYLAIMARDELCLTPLCVNVSPCEPTARGERNLRNGKNAAPHTEQRLLLPRRRINQL